MIIGRRKPKRWEENLLYCHFVHHKSHVQYPKVEIGSPQFEHRSSLPEVWNRQTKRNNTLKRSVIFTPRLTVLRIHSQGEWDGLDTQHTYKIVA